MKIITIIVSYNFERWIDKCLSSLERSDVKTDVLVIDNLSTDNTVAMIRRDFPKVRVIQNDRNLGFGQANNMGLRLAITEGYDQVFLMNQDAWILPETIGVLSRLCYENPEFGIISPVHMSGKNPDQLDFGFAAYSKLARVDQIDRFNSIVQLPFINAAFWMISVENLKKIGGFNPLFYHYGEDKDYVNRACFKGLKCGYSTNSFAFHDREQNKISKNKFFSLEKIYYLTELSNPNYSRLKRILFGAIAPNKKLIISLLRFKFSDGWEYLRVFFSLVGSFRKTEKSVRMVKNNSAYL